ncbi:MAG: GAF domain-containing sensor histidine kinase [Candidatus Dojkabacteria bacterium]
MFNLFSKTEKLPDDLSLLKNRVNDLNLRLEAIAEVNKSLVGVINQQKVFDLITKKLAPSIKMNFPSIWIYNEQKGTVTLTSHNIPSSIRFIAEQAIGRKIEDLSFSKDNPEENNSTYFKVIETGQPIYSKDLYQHTRPFLNEGVAKTLEVVSGMKLAVSVPIIVEDKPIGILSAIWQEEVLSKEDELTLFTFANQISTAIYNAQLFEQVETQVASLSIKNQDLQSLYNLTAQVSKSLDPAEVAQTAVNSIPQDKFIVGAILAEHQKEGNILQNIALTENATYFAVTKIIDDPKKYKLDIDAENTQFNLAVKAFKQSTPQFSNSLKDYLSPSLPAPLISAVEKILPLKSVASYPLIIRGEVIGTLSFLIKEKTVEELTESEKQLLGTYTYHITIALENAELYKQQKETQANLETALSEVQALRQHEQDMIDIMGHELRTPISIVRNALGMLELELKNTGEIRKDNLAKFLDISMESARREVKLVETLLSSAKADSRGFQLIFEKVDFLDVVNDSLQFFTREAEKKGLQIKYTKPIEEIFVYTDRTRIQEVMDNLLSNAVKYTEKGFIKINVRKEADYAWIEVSDTGIGMNDKDLKSIGQKFYRVDQYMDNGPVGAPVDKPNIIRPGGTGLGLYVTFSLVKVMDGKMDVKSQIGVGTTFAFSMPLYKGQESKQEQRKP